VWTTSGSGTFSDPASVNPVYTFGASDTGPVTLTMSVSNGFCTDGTDNLTVTFLPSPTADAGPDAGLCRSESGYQVAGASHSGGTVLWKTSGNGTFSDPAADNPYYTFGTSDFLAGSATLTMEVTGTGLCSTAESTAVITINPLPAITVTGLTDVTCPGLNDAEIHLSVTSGAAPVTYSIDGSPFQASGDFTDLAPGDWYFEVMDGNGCLSDTTITVTEPLPFTVVVDNVTNVTCNGGNNGSVGITAAGGTLPYSISWTGPDGFTASTEDISGLTAGVYDLTITDRYGCASFSFSLTLNEPPAITVTGVVLSDHNGFGVTCPSGNDGSVNLTVGGGTAPLATAWSGPGGFSSASEDIADLEPGLYTLTVTDAAGCTFIGEYVLTAPEPMTVTSVTETGSCPDVADGSIDITVTGGTGTLTYQWEDGITLPDRPAILPGEHTVTITDANGCLVEQSVMVEMTGYNCLRVFEIITPNGDGRNDTWKMRNADLYPDAEVFVYNRWGKLVFNTRNAAGDEWDGTYKGKLLPNDSYHYVIYLNDGSEPRTGVISIISK
jgi:gliding motility-associated-like protein